jgi:hypothetical protein
MNPELGVDGSDFLGFPEVRLAQIMHHVARFFPSGELVRVCEPTGWIGVRELVCATRLGLSAVVGWFVRGTAPRLTGRTA